jgi:host factor-I protein
MSSKSNEDIQQAFLTALITAETPVWVYLISGVRLNGVIASCDKFMVHIRSNMGVQVVFKHAVSTVCEVHALPGGTKAVGESMMRRERSVRRSATR